MWVAMGMWQNVFWAGKKPESMYPSFLIMTFLWPLRIQYETLRESKAHIKCPFEYHQYHLLRNSYAHYHFVFCRNIWWALRTSRTPKSFSQVPSTQTFKHYKLNSTFWKNTSKLKGKTQLVKRITRPITKVKSTFLLRSVAVKTDRCSSSWATAVWSATCPRANAYKNQ